MCLRLSVAFGSTRIAEARTEAAWYCFGFFAVFRRYRIRKHHESSRRSSGFPSRMARSLGCSSTEKSWHAGQPGKDTNEHLILILLFTLGSLPLMRPKI